MARRTSEYGVSKIKTWEGLSLKAKRDIAGILTIGYGHTSEIGPPVVTSDMTISPQGADTLLRIDLKVPEGRVDRHIKVPLSDNQFAALVAWDFNTGGVDDSALTKKLNKGDYASVPDELRRWVYVTDPKTKKKTKSDGLKNRRALEVALWLEDQPLVAAAGTTKAGAIITKESVTWGTGIAATLGSTVNGNGVIQYVLAAIIAVSFTIGLYIFISNRRKK